jgi:hypothetical protein
MIDLEALLKQVLQKIHFLLDSSLAKYSSFVNEFCIIRDFTKKKVFTSFLLLASNEVISFSIMKYERRLLRMNSFE